MTLTPELLDHFRATYEADPTNRLVEGAVAHVGIERAAYNPAALARHTFEFSISVDTGEITDQRKSGRCWLFASLNSLRPAVMARLNVETMEFSQSYLFFYDKLEKAATFLDHVVDTLDAPDDDRAFRLALTTHVSDGGDWDYFVSLIAKWGIVPHQAMPDSFNATDSARFVTHMELRLKRRGPDAPGTCARPRRRHRGHSPRDPGRHLYDCAQGAGQSADHVHVRIPRQRQGVSSDWSDESARILCRLHR
ncbi:hypothetical protein H8R18_04105 [Nanchangia anserum]|uniref:Aminopeptidase n=1 Tax=Nanchangia anserum TaxID=2692125 RepID=A0A8I0G6L5_9ACTO|nr:hypothetical protein [Nanchangia anserum]QOX82483.1 hypothetical protein H8R18_04105 [Nanchangia anserum]